MRPRAFMIVLLATLLLTVGTPSANAGLQSNQRGAGGSIEHHLGATSPPSAFTLGSAVARLGIAVQSSARRQLELAFAAGAKARLLLRIEGIQFKRRPEITYQVYVDLPKQTTPDYKSRYFVGNLTFFELPINEPGMKEMANLTFDVTQTAHNLESRNQWNDAELSVTFVPTWLVDHNGHPLPLPTTVPVRFSKLTLDATIMK
jgi:Protein of unknown function (DUF_B2219)